MAIRNKTQAPAKLELIAPDPKVHAEDMIELISRTFSQAGYYNFRDLCRKGYVIGSHYDWASSRIGLVNGRIVTHYGVWDWRMRAGSGVLRVGGIGVVATDPDFRGKGYMAETIGATHEAMRSSGYDMAMLFGIRDFYHRYGYCRAWADNAYYVERARLPKGSPKRPFREFPDLASDEVARLHNRENAALTGTAVRPTYRRMCHDDRSRKAYRWDDARGRLAGYVYVTTKWGKFECIGHGGDVEEVLKVLGALMKRAGYNEIKFFGVHYDSDLGRWLRRNNSRKEINFVKSGGPMVRTLNLATSLGKLSGVLSKRLRESCLSGWSGKLLVEDSRESAVLEIRRSRVSVSPSAKTRHSIRGGNEIAQLLIGTDDPGEVIDSADMSLSGDAKALAPVLFPNQHPNLAAWDRF